MSYLHNSHALLALNKMNCNCLINECVLQGLILRLTVYWKTNFVIHNVSIYGKTEI